MPVDLSPCSFLRYDDRHRVLICGECRYAIQKPAIESHLLRHKIYRGERQRLLALIARLDLLPPDQVQLPARPGPPVRGLPLISGLRCSRPDCGALYASPKRMRQHWSRVHRVTDLAADHAHSTRLQTFFRGTKIRYFEVLSGHSERAADTNPVDGPAAPASPVNEVEASLSSEQAPSPPSADPQADKALSESGRPTLDMDSLQYLHHFITVASLTLPRQEPKSTHHWQSHVVSRALQHPWLMAGLLALSAAHMASTLPADHGEMFTHMRFSYNYRSSFSATFETDTTVEEEERPEVFKIGGHIDCILRCSEWSNRMKRIAACPSASQAHPPLGRILDTVLGCSTRTVEPDKLLADTDQPRQPPRELLERLRSLPFRMSEVLGRPDSGSEVIAILASINSLVACFSSSFATGNANSIWLAMWSWLDTLPRAFSQMVAEQRLPPFSALAFWAVLVQRAEAHFWFLQDASGLLRRQIKLALVNHDALLELVGDLVE